MPQFDKRFVHFMWSDELEGKQVFYADSIHNLKVGVENNYNRAFVNHSDDENEPFSVKDGSFGQEYDWKFVYYDPHYEIKLSHEQGKKIECKRKGDAWEDWNYTPKPEWLDDYEYRIKPEEEKPVTNRELAMWLAMGNGQFCYYGDDGYESNVYPYHDYSMVVENENCETTELKVKVRKWTDIEWHLPTREYMGLN